MSDRDIRRSEYITMKSVNMKHIITEEYIKSDVYKNTLLKYLDDDCNPFFMEKNVKNFDYRHAHLKGLGAWKWLSTYRNKDIICDYIFSNLKGIDFGGYSAPIFGNSEVVDIYPPKMYRKIAHIRDEELDYIFTSHTLEHVETLEYILRHFFRILKNGGTLIVIVPSWNCKRWRAGGSTTHVRTFDLGDGDNKKYINIKKKIKESGFTVLRSEYTWDNSIFILATK